MKRGEEVAQGGQLALLTALGGGGERGVGQTCPCNQLHSCICSFPFHLSFSYLRSAVEASLDMKKFIWNETPFLTRFIIRWKNVGGIGNVYWRYMGIYLLKFVAILIASYWFNA